MGYTWAIEIRYFWNVQKPLPLPQLPLLHGSVMTTLTGSLDEEAAWGWETAGNIFLGGTVVMRRLYQIAALSFIFLGIFIVWESRILKYYTSLGPGWDSSRFGWELL